MIPPDPDLDAFAAALGSLAPSPSRLDRDALLYRAGQASSRRRPALARLAWPAIAATLAVVALGEAAILARRPGTRVVERVVVRTIPAPAPIAAPDPAPEPPTIPPSTEPEPAVILARSPENAPPWSLPAPSWTPPTEYARLRGQVLRFGLDALPEPPPLALHVRGTGEADGASDVSSGALLREEIDTFLKTGGPL